MAKEKVTVDQIMTLIDTRKMEQVRILEKKKIDKVELGIVTGRKRALDDLYKEIMDLEYAAIKKAERQ